jgi:hypothetical protein
MILPALLLASFAAAQPVVDDSDLSRPAIGKLSQKLLPQEGRPDGDVLVFPLKAPDSLGKPTAGAVTGSLPPLSRVQLAGGGDWQSIGDDGRFKIPAGGRVTLRVSLDNPLWKVRSLSGKSYVWEIAVDAPADLGALRPTEGENAKLFALHETYLQARALLIREGDLAWWTKTLTVNWPGTADYFSPWSFSLELTDLRAWDVVLHELGHAVMHGSMNAESAGGSHKIDECYSEALAWSEGWATYFAGAVRLSRDDADAKFEFLVPRRAPIRLENVPDDVCKGASNEWRVAAGFWDLLDRRDDGGDRFSMPFNALWAPLRGQRMGSVAQAWELVAKKLNAAERRAGEEALIHNFLLDAKPQPTAPAALPSF